MEQHLIDISRFLIMLLATAIVSRVMIANKYNAALCNLCALLAIVVAFCNEWIGQAFYYILGSTLEASAFSSVILFVVIGLVVISFSPIAAFIRRIIHR